MSGKAPLRMPPHLIERARALVGDGDFQWVVPPTRHAATVVMVADSPTGPHVYLQRRVRTMAFAAGMYVFPGGAVEEVDIAAARRIQFDPSASAEFVRVDPEALGVDTLAARIAAVRETQEEAAIRLGDPTALAYIAHWVTPEVEERRFDTRFYAAVVHVSDDVHESSQETDAQQWVRPQDALEKYFAGDMLMLPPTVAVLADFAEQIAAGCDSLAAVEKLAAQEVVPLMPSPYATPDGDIGWQLIDFRTGVAVAVANGAPAGSEVEGASNSESS